MPAPLARHSNVTANSLHQEPDSGQHLVAVPTCRLVDTQTAHLAIKVGHTRSFLVSGTDLSAQGGSPTGCGIPTDAQSLNLRVYATNAKQSGRFSLYPTGTPSSLASLYYQKGQVSTTSVNQPISPTATDPLTLKRQAGASYVIIYVTGYYQYDISGLIYTAGGTGGVYTGSPEILSVTHIAAGTADVTFARDVAYCSVTVSSYFDSGVYANGYAFNGNKARVFTWDINDTTHLPELSDNYAYLTVVC